MEPSENQLLNLLMRTARLTTDEAERTAAWWHANRQGDEELADFLVRQGMLTRAALHQVNYLRRGYLASAEGLVLLGPAELVHLRQRLETYGRSEAAFCFEAPADAEGTQTDVLTPALVSELTRRRAPTETAGSPVGDYTESACPSGGRASLTDASGPRVGSVLGKCLLTELVGQGATGAVFRGLHRTLNIPVAVKVLHFNTLDRDTAIRQQLRSEARLLAQLNHPHIVRVWDYEDEGDHPYLVLEYVQGLSLAELIQQSGRLRWDRAREVITQVARGLAAASKLGIVHRDVKPANILLTRDGSARLADLGLAVVSSNPALAQAADADSADAGMAGTAAYMSPEQARGQGVDHRSDMYGLGATFYHAITGRMPFVGRSRMEVILKHVGEAPMPPHELVTDLGAGVSTILLRMLAKQPGERFQTYEELLTALEGIDEPHVDLDTPSVASSKESPSKDRSSIWRTILGTLKGSAVSGTDR
jgi:tRNA A-37 threonylcarbamoyl transferase component Bud32